MMLLSLQLGYNCALFIEREFFFDKFDTLLIAICEACS